jgi:hypothetical protein
MSEMATDESERLRHACGAFDRIGRVFVDPLGTRWVLDAVFLDPAVVLRREDRPDVTRMHTINSHMGRELRPAPAEAESLL